MSRDPAQLELFEDLEVRLHRFKVGGEVDAPGLGPLAYRERRYLVVEVQCDRLTFDAADKNLPDLLARTHTLAVLHAAEHPDPLAAAMLLAGRAPEEGRP